MTAEPEAEPAARPDKAPDAFRTISEVADELDLPQHVLRFWETRFAQIKPMKRGGGRRYYRPQDVELLRGIRHLLYGEGYTIKGVQRILKEQGPRFVVAAAQGKPVPAAPPPGREADDPEPGEPPVAAARREPQLARPVVPPRPPAVEGKGAAARLEPVLRASGPRPPQEAPPVRAGHGALTAADIADLEAALLDLIECKRALDHGRG